MAFTWALGLLYSWESMSSLSGRYSLGVWLTRRSSLVSRCPSQPRSSEFHDQRSAGSLVVLRWSTLRTSTASVTAKTVELSWLSSVLHCLTSVYHVNVGPRARQARLSAQRSSSQVGLVASRRVPDGPCASWANSLLTVWWVCVLTLHLASVSKIDS